MTASNTVEIDELRARYPHPLEPLQRVRHRRQPARRVQPVPRPAWVPEPDAKDAGVVG